MKDIEDFKDEWRNEIKSDVTFIDFRIQKESKENLEFISNATGLSKSIVLQGILDDYLKVHKKRLNNLLKKRNQLNPRENDLLLGEDK
jgi:hypothetical protein